MALFGNSTKKTRKAKGERPAGKAVKDAENKLAGALLTPWLSEKALIATEKGVYTFRIPMTATKKDVMLAVQKYYKVTPRKVAVVNIPPKRMPLRKRRGFGTRSAERKAYVFLKSGETIQFA